MTQPDGPQSEPPPGDSTLPDRSMNNDTSAPSREISENNAPPEAQFAAEDSHPGQVDADQPQEPSEPTEPISTYREPKRVVPGLPRTQTFKRQLSEQRCHLEPVECDPDERRAMSMDRRLRTTEQNHHDSWRAVNNFHMEQLGREDQFGGLGDVHLQDGGYPDILSELGPDKSKQEHSMARMSESIDDGHSFSDDRSSLDGHDDDHDDPDREYDQIQEELENLWILNLSMRYKDHSDREKFFVTYREHEHHWRRVTVTLDYRHAPERSLEEDLQRTKMQRYKSRKIYDAIRESLQEIQFYDTVTNLKLETLGDRLHVHVVEDTNEVIHYPTVRQVRHLQCPLIREQDLVFGHHMSGFVYKVYVGGKALIKKEIPGPDTIEEFLYEINALNSLAYSDHVIEFYGLVVDDLQNVKGLLINFADGGALIDIIYDNCKNSREEKNKGIEWPLKERWARQIVNGLADVHESGFVQGDFTLSNIVIDEHDNAQIIDINRRGCPVGWEPPEATPLIESGHRISMYIGVKSDLYQLGMVLWALGMEEDEPEREGRPLTFGAGSNVPEWYQRITDICLDPDPRRRFSAARLASIFPEEVPYISIDEEPSLQGVPPEEYHPDGQVRGRSEGPSYDWWRSGYAHMPSEPPAYQSWNYAPRGRSPPRAPPSPRPSNGESPQGFRSYSGWAANKQTRASYSDAGDELRPEDVIQQQLTPSASAELRPTLSNPPNFESNATGFQGTEQLNPADVSLEPVEGDTTVDVAPGAAETAATSIDGSATIAPEHARGTDQLTSNDLDPSSSGAVQDAVSDGVAQDSKPPQVDEPAAVDPVSDQRPDQQSSDGDKTIPADQAESTENKSDDVTGVDHMSSPVNPQAITGNIEVASVEKGTIDQPHCKTEAIVPEAQARHVASAADVALHKESDALPSGDPETELSPTLETITDKSDLPVNQVTEVGAVASGIEAQLSDAVREPLVTPQDTTPASKAILAVGLVPDSVTPGSEEQKNIGVVHTTCELAGTTEPDAQHDMETKEVPAALGGDSTVTGAVQPHLEADKTTIESTEAPGNNASTPRTCRSGQEGTMKVPDALAFVGGGIPYDDALVYGKDLLLDEDFQISGSSDIPT